MSFFKKITESVSKGVSTAAEKAQQTVEITRLNAQISGKRKEIEKLQIEIGKSIFEAYKVKDLSIAESKVVPACDQIEIIHGEIAVLNNRIMALRNEKDCVCGRRVPYETRFCSDCGHPFPEPEPVAEVGPDDDGIAEYEAPRASDAGEWEQPPAPSEEQENAAAVDQRHRCKNCGTPLYADTHFCPSCGQSTQLN